MQTTAKAHEMNIRRYMRLLETKLTELERDYIEARLADERTQLERLISPSDAARAVSLSGFT